MSIEFVSTEISGLYAYLLSNGTFYTLATKKQDSALFDCMAGLQNNICSGNINDINKFNDFIKEKLPDRPEKTEQFCKKSICEMQEYSSFFQKNIEQVHKYKHTIEDTYINYSENLSKLYDFFDIDKTFRCYGILAPLPQKNIDGCAMGNGFMMFYDTKKKDSEKYVGNSLLPEKKISTPLHETSHILFGHSKIKKDLKNRQGNGANKLLSVLDKYFNDYPDLNGRNSIMAIDEAIASCPSMDVNTKNKPYESFDTFYYGFEAADKLAKSIYPIYQDYMKQGKKLDDNFFMQAATNFETQQKLENLRKQLSYSSPTSQIKTMGELRGISSATKVPYNPKTVTINPAILKLAQNKKQKV